VTTQEVYPCAPLRLVSLELKFPTTALTLTRSLWDRLESELSLDLPEVAIFVPNPDSHIPRGPDELILRRISEKQKRAVTLYAGSLTIELADYRNYEQLRRLVERTLSSLEDLPGAPMRYTRVGLRYINEIRAAVVGIPEDQYHLSKSWTPYIQNDLLGDIGNPPEGLCAFANRKSAYFHTLQGPEFITLDYGIHPEGFVDPSDVLKLDGDSGPCFVLDLDAFQQGTSEKPVAEDAEQLAEIVGRLHDVIESTFKWSVTNQAREVFRGPSGSASKHESLA
jgi:uncharacterized protein (TIGR04255 family)